MLTCRQQSHPFEAGGRLAGQAAQYLESEICVIAGSPVAMQRLSVAIELNNSHGGAVADTGAVKASEPGDPREVIVMHKKRCSIDLDHCCLRGDRSTGCMR